MDEYYQMHYKSVNSKKEKISCVDCGLSFIKVNYSGNSEDDLSICIVAFRLDFQVPQPIGLRDFYIWTFCHSVIISSTVIGRHSSCGLSHLA